VWANPCSSISFPLVLTSGLYFLTQLCVLSFCSLFSYFVECFDLIRFGKVSSINNIY
jgi:hypothetical protein